MTKELPSILSSWFAAKGWSPRRHQLEMLAAARAGRSALLIAPTGAGKTMAGFLPSLVELIEKPVDGLHTLYVSPLKALAVDVQRNLIDPIGEMGLPIRVETRTGDTPAERKARQRARPPQMLLTTPESLSLLLSHDDAPRLFEGLSTVEAAECLELSAEAVKTRLHRARVLLRDELFSRAGIAAPTAFSFHRTRCDHVVAAVFERLSTERPQTH